jgi:hypothetical protein
VLAKACDTPEEISIRLKLISNKLLLECPSNHRNFLPHASTIQQLSKSESRS